MRIGRVILALAAASLAASLYAQAQRAGRRTVGVSDEGEAPDPDRPGWDEWEDPDIAPTVSAPQLDSPNSAERLQSSNATGSPIGTGEPFSASVKDDDLFSSSSQKGPDPAAPGLPDLTRGA